MDQGDGAPVEIRSVVDAGRCDVEGAKRDPSA
jgi:hypothetical protein